MKRLAPGVYDDDEGGLHLDVGELLAANGWPDTPENRDTIVRAGQHMFGDRVEVTERTIEVTDG